MSRGIEVICDVDIEQTAASFHAHAVPDGVDIRPGDTVLVHDTPIVGFGERIRCTCRATLIRGGIFDRIAARMHELLSLTELYEVGFSPGVTRSEPP